MLKPEQSDKLYGRSLTALVTMAIHALTAEKKTILVRDIREKVLSDLKISMDQLDEANKDLFNRRTYSVLRDLKKSGFIDLEKHHTEIKTVYYSIHLNK